MIGWLRVVARREAIRLVRYDRPVAGLAVERLDGHAADACSACQEARDALANVAALPARKSAVLTLRVSGHSYGLGRGGAGHEPAHR